MAQNLTHPANDRNEDDSEITRTAANALLLMADNSCQTTAHMQHYEALPSPPDSDEDDEADKPTPVMLEAIGDLNGPQTDEKMITATNFSIMEFYMVWNDLRDDVTEEFNTGRGRRFRDSPKDIFFMMLCCLKHKATWDWHAIGFNREKSTFKRMVGKMLAVLYPIVMKK